MAFSIAALSISISIIGIWLSIKFHKSNKKTHHETSSEISYNVGKVESKIVEIKKEIFNGLNELSEILNKQQTDSKITDGGINNLKTDLNNLIEKAISNSRNVEIVAREETLRNYILERLQGTKNKPITAIEFQKLIQERGMSPSLVFKEVEKMGEEGILNLSKPTISGPDVKISLR